MTNPADRSAADGAAMRHTLTVQAEIPPSPHPEPEQSPAGGELDLDALEQLHREATKYGAWSVFYEDGKPVLRGLGRIAKGYIATSRDFDLIEHAIAALPQLIALARQAPAPSGGVALMRQRLLDAASPGYGTRNRRAVLIEAADFLAALAASLAPAPSGGDERSDVRVGLEAMRRTVERWISYNTAQRDREGLATDDDTHLVAPPTWPNHGALNAWVAALTEADAILSRQAASAAVLSPVGGDLGVSVDESMCKGTAAFASGPPRSAGKGEA